MRQADLERERRALQPGGEPDDMPTEVRELVDAGVSLDLAGIIAYHDERDASKPLPDQAEAAVLEHLTGLWHVDVDNPAEAAIVRKQAAYARKLNVRMVFLENNTIRNLRRLDSRRAGRRRKHPRVHHELRRLTPEQSRQAEYLWLNGAHHGLTYHQALHTKARENPAVYRRVHRILQKVMST